MPASIAKGAKNYQNCHNKTVSHYMKKFKKGQLEQKDKKKVSKPGQAIAMALSIANKDCAPLMKKEDVNRLEAKLERFLKEKDQTVQLADIKNAEKVIKYYANQNKPKAQQMANRLYKKINQSAKKQKVTPRLVKETVALQTRYLGK